MITDSDLHEMIKIAVIELALLIPFALFAIWLDRRMRKTAAETDDEPEGSESSSD